MGRIRKRTCRKLLVIHRIRVIIRLGNLIIMDRIRRLGPSRLITSIRLRISIAMPTIDRRVELRLISGGGIKVLFPAVVVHIIIWVIINTMFISRHWILFIIASIDRRR